MKNPLKISLLLLFLINASFVCHDSKEKEPFGHGGLEKLLASLNEDQALNVSFENNLAVYTIVAVSSMTNPCGTTEVACMGSGASFGECIDGLGGQNFIVYSCGPGIWCACLVP